MMMALYFLAIAAFAVAADSNKRGLVFVPNDETPQDNRIWVQKGSDLTWYYNYGDEPSPVYASRSQGRFEFVPMMWGVSKDHPEDTAFLDNVKSLIDDGTDIKHVLGFNEPDMVSDWGGSDVAPRDAAKAWIANFEPLGKMGVKLGLPACTGGYSSLPWLKQFLGNCSQLLSHGTQKEKNCTWDFLPVHWYDNFDGLQSHIDGRRAAFPNTSIWITEYAYAHQDLDNTQDFFNQSIDYFDREDYVGRYTYFGAFRSDVSNVGPNAAFLNSDGDLTDIGSWYLGFDATGVDPESAGVMMDSPSSVALIVGMIGAAVLGLL